MDCFTVKFRPTLSCAFNLTVHSENLLEHLQHIVTHTPPHMKSFTLDWEEMPAIIPAGVAPLLGQLTALESLNTRKCHFYESMEPLRALTQLTSLRMPLGDSWLDRDDDYFKMGDSGLDVVASLPRLAFLDLEDSTITDLLPLTRLTGLTRLVLRGCSVKDLSCLDELQELQGVVVVDPPTSR